MIISKRPKYKYSFNSQTYNLEMSPSIDHKIGVTRINPQTYTMADKSKSNISLTLDKIVNRNNLQIRRNSTGKKDKVKDYFIKLPQIHKNNKSDVKEPPKKTKIIYYQSKLVKSLKVNEDNYLMNLARQHFLQTIEALRIGKDLKLQEGKIIKLSKKNPSFKTIFLDLDETLVHCDEQSNNYTVKLNFPIEGGSTISAGIRVRPYCQQFLKQLSSIAEVIIFTASSSSYADVVLNHLDPHKKIFAHRLYRQHCTLEKGFYTKDLRRVNRRPQDIALVDNSGFCFMTQPENGIPILPFYHYAKDKQLLILLEFLKTLITKEDMRDFIKETFLWDKYLQVNSDPTKIFLASFDKK